MLAVRSAHCVSVMTSALVKCTMEVANPFNGAGRNSDSLYVCDDISSRIDQIKVEGSIDLEDNNVSNTTNGTVSTERR